MLRALSLIVALFVMPSLSTAAPLRLAELAGFGGPDSLDAVQDLTSRRQPDYLLARISCVDLDCRQTAGIAGRLDAALFDVDAVASGGSGSWTFAGATEAVNQSVSRLWFVQYVVIQTTFGSHVSNQLFAPVGVPFTGIIDVFSGGPVEWTKPHGLDAYPTNHLTFYGSTVRVPEPATVLLLGAGGLGGLIVRLHRRRRR